MARNVNADRVTAAKISGTAAGVAHTKRITTDEGLAEVDVILRDAGVRPGSDRAAAILNAATAMYRDSDGTGPRWWFPAALVFLIGCGADPQAQKSPPGSP